MSPFWTKFSNLKIDAPRTRRARVFLCLDVMNGPDQSTEPGDRLFRLVAASALALGVGSGGYTLSTTDDRIRRAEVESALRLRDVQIQFLDKRVDELNAAIKRIDSAGPAVGNPDFQRRIAKLEADVEALR